MKKKKIDEIKKSVDEIKEMYKNLPNPTTLEMQKSMDEIEESMKDLTLFIESIMENQKK